MFSLNNSELIYISAVTAVLIFDKVKLYATVFFSFMTAIALLL